jgi:hypothetical protein
MLRAGLTIILIVTSLLAMYSWFFAAWASGATGTDHELGSFWKYQAAFRFSVAMLFWFFAILVFVGLRPNGLLRTIKGDQISSFKRWLYIAALIVSLSAVVSSVPEVIANEFKIDRCLDQGGKWIYSTNHCQFEQSQP